MNNKKFRIFGILLVIIGFVISLVAKNLIKSASRWISFTSSSLYYFLNFFFILGIALIMAGFILFLIGIFKNKKLKNKGKAL
jgi:uncharacterized membrane protein